MSDVTDRLNTLKAQIEQGKTEKAKAEANLDVYTKQKEDLVKQLAEMGVTLETLDGEIERLDREIAAGLDQAEALLKG
jgi:chromosome segregation ATPase